METEEEKYRDIWDLVDNQDKKTLEAVLIERISGELKRVIYKYE